jgi:hypothetical protein
MELTIFLIKTKKQKLQCHNQVVTLNFTSCLTICKKNLDFIMLHATNDDAECGMWGNV